MIVGLIISEVKVVEEIFLNEFVGVLIQTYKNNEKLFQRQLEKWHRRSIEKDQEKTVFVHQFINRNKQTLQNIVGKPDFIYKTGYSNKHVNDGIVQTSGFVYRVI